MSEWQNSWDAASDLPIPLPFFSASFFFFFFSRFSVCLPSLGINISLEQ